jgi:hypothetical protein
LVGAEFQLLPLPKEGFTDQEKGKQGSVVHAGDPNACYVEVGRMLRRGPLDLEFEVKMGIELFLKTQCELQNSRTSVLWCLAD